jgi:hypothetical protein
MLIQKTASFLGAVLGFGLTVCRSFAVTPDQLFILKILVLFNLKNIYYFNI